MSDAIVAYSKQPKGVTITITIPPRQDDSGWRWRVIKRQYLEHQTRYFVQLRRKWIPFWYFMHDSFGLPAEFFSVSQAEYAARRYIYLKVTGGEAIVREGA